MPVMENGKCIAKSKSTTWWKVTHSHLCLSQHASVQPTICICMHVFQKWASLGQEIFFSTIRSVIKEVYIRQGEGFKQPFDMQNTESLMQKVCKTEQPTQTTTMAIRKGTLDWRLLEYHKTIASSPRCLQTKGLFEMHVTDRQTAITCRLEIKYSDDDDDDENDIDDDNNDNNAYDDHEDDEDEDDNAPV